MTPDGSDDAFLTAEIESLFDGERRGVSDVLGVILLLGLVIAVATLAVGMGGNALQQTQGDAELQKAENSFAELDSRASAVALSEGPGQRGISLGLDTGYESELAVEQNMSIQIQAEGFGDDEDCAGAAPDDPDCFPLPRTQIGSIVYTHGDTQIAYEAGGLWKHNPSTGHTEMLSPPTVEYDDATLTMPLVNVETDPQRLHSDDVMFTRGTSEVPDGTSRPVEAELVTVVIESPYYEGWGDYFENYVEGNVETEYDHENNMVAIQLGLSGEIYGSFDSAIVAGGDVYTGNNGWIYGPVLSSGDIEGNVDGNTYENVHLSLQQLDPHIEELLIEGRELYEDLGVVDESMTLGEGRYYAEEIDLESGEDLVLNVAEGPITIVVDGETNLTNSANIRVVEDDSLVEDALGVIGSNHDEEERHARVLTNDDFSLNRGGPTVSVEDSPKQFQLYGGSETNVLVSQDASFDGVIYAPSDRSSSHGGNIRGGGAMCHNTDYDVCIGAGADIYGAVVGGSTMVGQAANLTYDDNLVEFEPQVSPDDSIRPRLLHLHVSINNVHVDED